VSGWMGGRLLARLAPVARPAGQERLARVAGPARLAQVARIGLLAVACGVAAAGGAGAAAPASAAGSLAAGNAAAAGNAGTLTVAEYRRRLVDLQGNLRRGDWEAVRRGAASLEAGRVRFAGGTVAADRSLLGPLAAMRGGAGAARPALRLVRLIAALPAPPPTVAPAAAAGARSTRDAVAAAGGAGHGAIAPADAALPPVASPAAGGAPASGAPPPIAPAPAAAGVSPDRALLEKLRREQALPELPAGGRLPDPGLSTGNLLETLVDFLRPAGRTVAAWWERFWKWLLRWLEGLVSGTPHRHPLFSLWSVEVLVVILAVAMLALAARAWWRRRRRGGAVGAVAATAAPSPARDDDPFSRGASEWETYARELAAAGRFREAIRAWYHAVLVVLYQSGALHFRKGRTNWEYIATVPPGTPWRPALVEITRQFEREWYGRERSSAEALDASSATARHLLATLRSAAA
jgi:hypothetical protein